MLAVALHLRSQELSLRDIAARLVISTGKKNGQHPVTGHPDAHAPRARREDHSALPGLAGPSGVRPERRDGGGRKRLVGDFPLPPSGYLRSSCRRLREPDGRYIIGPTTD
jgi:hypothetical protein